MNCWILPEVQGEELSVRIFRVGTVFILIFKLSHENKILVKEGFDCYPRPLSGSAPVLDEGMWRRDA